MKITDPSDRYAWHRKPRWFFPIFRRIQKVISNISASPKKSLGNVTCIQASIDEKKEYNTESAT